MLCPKKKKKKNQPETYTELPVSLVSFCLWFCDQRLLFLDFSSLGKNHLEGRV